MKAGTAVNHYRTLHSTS